MRAYVFPKFFLEREDLVGSGQPSSIPLEPGRYHGSVCDLLGLGWGHLTWGQSGFPRWPSGKEPACSHRRYQFHPWIPLRRKQQPTPAFCLESPMDRGAWWATKSPWGRKESGTAEHVGNQAAFSWISHLLALVLVSILVLPVFCPFVFCCCCFLKHVLRNFLLSHSTFTEFLFW